MCTVLLPKHSWQKLISPSLKNDVTHPLRVRQMRTELYFLSSQKNRPSLFGMPLIVPCTVHTSKKDLYDAVWIQVSRLASPLPPQEASNHAQDW